VVLQISSSMKNILANETWEDVAEGLICRFENLSDFKNVFGDKDLERKAPAGYTTAYCYGEHPFYLAVAYHTYYNEMGVVVKFSAQALDYYCETSGLTVYEFLQKIQHSDYSLRLSRIDLTADYIDENIDVTNIYQSLIDNKVALFREYTNKRTGKLDYQKVKISCNGFLQGEEVPTAYLGSAKSNCRLRIYNKRLEQIQRKGTKYDKAVACNSWTRFEGVFRNEYSHQLTVELLKINNDMEFADLVASTLSNKFHFMTVANGVAECETEYTQMLMDCVKNKNFKLKATSTKNFDLVRSIVYMFYGSGVMNSFYKIRELWGIDAVKELMEYLQEELQDSYTPNEDCIYWLKKHRMTYIKKYPTFDSFLKDNISVLP